MIQDDARAVLRQFDQDWNNTEPAPSSGEVPDGTYEALVYAARITRSKSGERLMLEWELIIIEGEYESRKVWDYQFLDDPERFPWIKKRFNICNIHLPRLSDLPEKLENLVGSLVEITIKTKKQNGNEYRNVYFNRRLEDHPGEPAKDQPFNEDDVPF